MERTKEGLFLSKWQTYDERTKNLYLSTNMSIPEVAKHFGIPYYTLTKRFRKMGIKGHRSESLKGRPKSLEHRLNLVKFAYDRTGKNNPNWQGGIQNEWSEIKNSEEYKNWHRQVLKKDNYICQGCGQKSGKIQAHHILPRKLFPFKIFDVQNGITLCKVCHRKVHSVNKIKEGELLETLKPLRRATTISSQVEIGIFQKVHRLIAESRTDGNADKSALHFPMAENEDIVGACRKLQETKVKFLS